MELERGRVLTAARVELAAALLLRCLAERRAVRGERGVAAALLTVTVDLHISMGKDTTVGLDDKFNEPVTGWGGLGWLCTVEMVELVGGQY
eukprot:scaffold138324_cov39-Tisochrysis_lutea.AAC.1